MKLSMKAFGTALLLLALTGKLFSADTRKSQAQAQSAQVFAGELIEGTGCVSFIAGMRRGKGLTKRAIGKGRNKQTQFYFHGSGVNTFPTLPPDGIPVDAQLTVQIYVNDRQMKTFVLAL